MTVFSGRPDLPQASSAAVSARMSQQRNRDTGPEMALRRELHRRGHRFRVARRPVAELRSTADIVFGPARVAVYVDGCFWHSCPEHATQPVSNGAWWAEKLARNRERDKQTDEALAQAGWTVVRVWEHERCDEAADRVAAALSESSGSVSPDVDCITVSTR
jgi:DNA mismatch endonuclease, patch repair protein